MRKEDNETVAISIPRKLWKRVGIEKTSRRFPVFWSDIITQGTRGKTRYRWNVIFAWNVWKTVKEKYNIPVNIDLLEERQSVQELQLWSRMANVA